MTAGEAIRSLHTVDPGVQTLDNLYAVREDDTLLGMVPLRDVFRAAPERPVADLVQALPVTVGPQTDREEVARLVSHYDLSSIPVVDSAGRILGIVTVDDVIDVFADEFSEDYLRMAGTDAEEMARRTPVQVARLRLPWLLGTMAIELLAGLVIARFDDVLREVILLASFMPVISAVSGNAGLQAAAIVVRGLDTGHVSVKNWSRQLRKEMVTALVMALTCGVVLGAIGALWSQRLPFGVVIGVALAGAMLTAGFMGTVIPIVSKRLGFDPATTAGPFETAFQDVIGFAVFLWLASLLIDWLV
jgi:magnesium transporter